MKEFVKLSPAFWTSKAGKQLKKAGPVSQLIALYLVSNPHSNWICCYNLPLAYISVDTGLTEAQVLQGLADCEAVGLSKYDHDAEVLWLMDGAAQQIGEELKATDKRCVAVQREFNDIPDCEFVAEFFKKYAKAYNLKARADMEQSLPFDSAAAKGATPAVKQEATVAKAAPVAHVPVKAEDAYAATETLKCVENFLFAREVSYKPNEDVSGLIAILDEVRERFDDRILDKALELAVEHDDFELAGINGYLHKASGAQATA